MPYLGRQLSRGENRLVDDITSTFNGSLVSFNLTVGNSAATAGSANQLWVNLGGIMQKPGVDFTTSGSQITFTTAPTAGLSCWILIQGDAIDVNTPADASVIPSKIANNNVFSFPAKTTSNLELVAASDGNVTLTAAQSINSLVTMTPESGRNVTTSSAAAIVTELGAAKVGTSFSIILRNQAASTHALTLVAGTGVTLATDNTNTVAATKTRQFIGRVTNVGSGSEALTIYSMGEAIH